MLRSRCRLSFDCKNITRTLHAVAAGHCYVLEFFVGTPGRTRGWNRAEVDESHPRTITYGGLGSGCTGLVWDVPRRVALSPQQAEHHVTHLRWPQWPIRTQLGWWLGDSGAQVQQILTTRSREICWEIQSVIPGNLKPGILSWEWGGLKIILVH